MKYTKRKIHSILLVATLLLAPLHTLNAAIVDQEVDLTLTVGFIGEFVPYSLSIGDIFNGRITVSNVDNAAADGVQTSVTLIDHMMTIGGDSYDSAINFATNAAQITGGEVTAINFASANADPLGTGTVSTNTLQYFTDGGWRILFTGWSSFDPTNYRYELTGGYTAQVVPIPAAVWLFGSGLIGLIGIARRRKL